MSNLTTTEKQKWFSSPKNISTTIVAACLFIGLGYLFLTFVLPWLVTVTWNLVSFVIAATVLCVLLMIVTNKKFWRAIKYLSEFLGRYTLGVVIEMNEFNILKLQVAQGYKDREKLREQGLVVKAKQSEIAEKLKEKKDELEKNKIKAQHLQKLQQQRPEETSDDEIMLYANKVQSYSEYINNVSPILNDLEYISKFCDKAWKSVGIKLDSAKTDIEIKQDMFETITSGASVAKKAWKALTGDEELNQDAETAMNSLRKKVASSLAEMKDTMIKTNEIIRDIDLNNVVNARKGIDKIKQLESGVIDITPRPGNLDTIKQQSDSSSNRFKGLLD